MRDLLILHRQLLTQFNWLTTLTISEHTTFDEGFEVGIKTTHFMYKVSKPPRDNKLLHLEVEKIIEDEAIGRFKYHIQFLTRTLTTNSFLIITIFTPLSRSLQE